MPASEYRVREEVAGECEILSHGVGVHAAAPPPNAARCETRGYEGKSELLRKTEQTPRCAVASERIGLDARWGTCER